MTTTPTPEDHAAAKRVADRCRLDAAPWQLEHLAAAIADARPANLTGAYASRYRMGLADAHATAAIAAEALADELERQVQPRSFHPAGTHSDGAGQANAAAADRIRAAFASPAPAPQDERTAVQRDIDASLMAERLAVHQENRRIHSALPDACPVCGASSPTEHCTTVSGRDHAARNRPSR